MVIIGGPNIPQKEFVFPRMFFFSASLDNFILDLWYLELLDKFLQEKFWSWMPQFVPFVGHMLANDPFHSKLYHILMKNVIFVIVINKLI